jgi:CBS domain-containing protein
MQVRDGMSPTVLTVGPSHSLREAATQMTERNVGAAVVHDPDLPGPGIITERDVLRSVGAGESPDDERVGDHMSSDLVFATPEWSLEEAASAMAKGGFRHLIVVERGEVLGVISVRDIIRCWSEEGATSVMSEQRSASGG